MRPSSTRFFAHWYRHSRSQTSTSTQRRSIFAKESIRSISRHSTCTGSSPKAALTSLRHTPRPRTNGGFEATPAAAEEEDEAPSDSDALFFEVSGIAASLLLSPLDWPPPAFSSYELSPEFGLVAAVMASRSVRGAVKLEICSLDNESNQLGSSKLIANASAAVSIAS